MNKYLPYDPGVLPSAPAPLAGESIEMKSDGYPPYKDIRFSIRNSRHKFHSRFIALRQAAIKAMAGRAPYRGAVRIDFVMHAPDFESNKGLVNYLGGIMDTLDGSHGTHFTYLPIAYEDDCQVATGNSEIMIDQNTRYEVKVIFLNENRCDE